MRAAGVLLKSDRLEEAKELLDFLNREITDHNAYLSLFTKALVKMEHDRAAIITAWQGILRPSGTEHP